MDRRALLGLAAGTAVATPARAGPGGAASSGGAYIPMPLITASILSSDGRRGILSIESGIDISNAALVTTAQQSLPRLRAAYTAAAQRIANGTRLGTPPNVEQIARDLQAATDSTLGRQGARLLIGTVLSI